MSCVSWGIQLFVQALARQTLEGGEPIIASQIRPIDKELSFEV